jgi:RND family efflux transporter MFP subunit
MEAVMKYIVGVLIILLMVFYQTDLFGHKKISPGAKAVEGTLSQGTHFLVKAQEVMDYYEESALINTKRNASISSEVMGVIGNIMVSAGDKVTKEQVLLEIDNSSAKILLKKAKESYIQAQTLKNEASERLIAAKASQKEALLSYQRYKDTFSKGATTKEKVEQVESKFTQSNAILKATQEALKNADVGIEKAKSAVHEATLFLEKHTIKAPFDGQITSKEVESGELASPATKLFSIHGTNHYQAIAHLKESTVGKVKVGDAVIIESQGKSWKGMVQEVFPHVDSKTRTYRIKVDFTPDNPTYVGAYAKVKIPIKKRSTVLVPMESVYSLGQIKFVKVLKKDKILNSNVRTGLTYDGFVEVVSGLKPGTTIVMKETIK